MVLKPYWTLAFLEMQCPDLTPPENGYFVRNTCSNVVNAACGIRCNPGYTLQGSSIRLCGEDGTWSGGDAQCVSQYLPDFIHFWVLCFTSGFNDNSNQIISCSLTDFHIIDNAFVKNCHKFMVTTVNRGEFCTSDISHSRILHRILKMNTLLRP